MNFAVVEIAGKQFLVRKGDIIETPKISGSAGEKVNFPSVLLYWDGKKVAVGRPRLDGFAIEGRIVEFDRSPKVLVYKYKRRKDSHRKIGHRQDLARVEIEKIKTPGKSSEEPSPPPAGEKSRPAAGKPAGKKTAAKKTAAGKKPPAAKKTVAGKKPAAGKKKSAAAGKTESKSSQ